MATPQASPPIVNLQDLWRYKWRIILTILVFVGAGAAYLYITPTTYEVSCRVVVREDNPTIDPANLALKDREFLATQAEIIRSPVVVQEALQEVPVTVPADYEKSDTTFVLETLAVIPVIQTDVLKISYRSEQPQQAKEFVTALVQQFERYVQKDDQVRHIGELELLSRREDALRQQLEDLQNKRLEFRKSSPLVGATRESVTVQSNQLSLLAQRLNDARARRMELEHKLKTYSVAKSGLGPGGSLSPVVAASLITTDEVQNLLPPDAFHNADSDPATNVLRDSSNAEGEDFKEIQMQLWQARVNLKQLSNKYTPNHPEMNVAQEQVRYWEDLLKERVQAAEFGLSQELVAARSTEANLQQLHDDENVRVKEVDNYLVEEESLAAQVVRAEELHAGAVARLNEYRLTEAAMEEGRSSVVVQVLDGPELQEEVVWPQPKVLLALCGCLGLAAGVMLVSVRSS